MMSEDTQTNQDLRERAHHEGTARRRKLFQDGELNSSDSWDKGYGSGYLQGFQDGAQWHANQLEADTEAAQRNESLGALLAEYRPTMDADVLHDWAREVLRRQPSVDDIAQAIRVADGDHTMGAGELAEVVHALFQGETGTGKR